MILNTLNTKLEKESYRPDIDGIRAIAIIAVIINHTDKSILPGGYLGVDIFFVISGFVITLSLANRKNKNFVKFFTGFFERRLKRLFPALIIFCVITALILPLFDPVPGISLRTAITGLFGFSNLYLLNNAADYFAPATELNPFSHTWSLDVEEQFYVIFPILIWFSGFGKQTIQGRRNLFYLILTLSLASLIGYLYIFQLNRTAAYYLMPTRFWEMAAGCLIYLIKDKSSWFVNLARNIPSSLYILLMLITLFIPENYNFQATLMIVLTSSFLILSLKKNTLVYKLLTLDLSIHIGLISYSLYLWHWGILSLSRWTIGITWWTIPIQMLLIYFISYLSYKYIEIPFQNFKKIKSWATIFFAAISLVIANSIIFTFGILQRNQRFFLGAKTTELTNPKILPYIPNTNINNKNCLEHNKLSQALENCRIELNKKNRTIFFVGDSMNEAITQAAGQISKELNNNILVHSKQGSLLPVNTYYLKGDITTGMSKNSRLKTDLIQKEFETYLIENIKENDIVVLSVLYSQYFAKIKGFDTFDKEFIFFDSKGIKLESQEAFFDDWINNLKRFNQSLNSKGASAGLASR